VGSRADRCHTPVPKHELVADALSAAEIRSRRPLPSTRIGQLLGLPHLRTYIRLAGFWHSPFFELFQENCRVCAAYSLLAASCDLRQTCLTHLPTSLALIVSLTPWFSHYGLFPISLTPAEHVLLGSSHMSRFSYDAKETWRRSTEKTLFPEPKLERLSSCPPSNRRQPTKLLGVRVKRK